MRKIISLFIVFSLFLVRSASAQIWGWEWYDVSWWWTVVFGLSEEWMAFPSIIYNFIIPFIAIFAVCLGFLRQIRIFYRAPNIEIALAFCMAFGTLPSHAFVTIVGWTLGIMGGYAYVVFILLFLFGVGWYFVIRMRGWSAEAEAAHRIDAAKDIRDQISRETDKVNALRAKMGTTTDKLRRGEIDRYTYEIIMTQLRATLIEAEERKNTIMERLKGLERA